jgi:DNA-binding NarL/FixJ family response regulator
MPLALAWLILGPGLPVAANSGRGLSFRQRRNPQSTDFILSMDRLTPRQYQVAMLVARGLSNKEVARHLGISDGTVKLHVHGILKKLGVKRRLGVIAMTMIVRESETPAE